MKGLGRILVLALAVALIAPGLVAGLVVCAMTDCPAMAAGDHDCCPRAAAQLTAACCGQGLDASAAVAKLPERLDPTCAAAPPDQVAILLLPPVVVGPGVVAAAPPRPLDSLARSCILRI